MRYLARRLGFDGAEAAAQFVAHYEQHSSAVRRVYRHYLMAEDATTARFKGGSAMTQLPVIIADGEHEGGNPRVAIVKKHLSRLAPSYAATFSEADIADHAEMAACLDETNPVEVEAVRGPGEGLWRVTIVGYDFLGELSLILRPALRLWVQHH